MPEVKLAEDGSCYLDSDGNKYPRVSNIITAFFGGEKDPKQMLANMKPDNRKRTYDDMTDEVILQKWKDNSKMACDLGTQMHDAIERFIVSGDKEDPTTDDFDRFIEAFWEPLVVNGDLKFYAAEQRLTYQFSETFRMAGTFDALFTNSKGEYVLCDWKRSKNIVRGKTWPKLEPKAPSTKLGWYDNSWHHYALQLNIYKRMWETANPDKPVVQLLLVCMHSNHGEDRVMEVPIMKDETVDHVFREVSKIFSAESK